MRHGRPGGDDTSYRVTGGDIVDALTHPENAGRLWEEGKDPGHPRGIEGGSDVNNGLWSPGLWFLTDRNLFSLPDR